MRPSTRVTAESLGEVDVAVLGGGPGGLAAAAEAARFGLEVAVIERLDSVGGNLGPSSGYTALAGTRFQERLGLDDNFERFLADMEREARRTRERYGGYFDPAVAQRYAKESRQVYEWLEELGVGFRGVIDRPLKHHVARMHALEDPTKAVQALAAECERWQVYLLTGMRVVEVVRDGGFRLVLVREHSEQLFEAKARIGIVIATGGFQANYELRSELQPYWLAQTPYLGVPTALGDGHRILEALGARLVNMSYLPPFSHIATSFAEEAIAVNVEGRRFHDETDPYESPRHLAAQPQRRAFYVFDDRVMREKEPYITSLGRDVASGKTLSQLAQTLGIMEAPLQLTIDTFNRALADGAPDNLEAPRLNPPKLPIGSAPFYAIEMVVGMSVSYGGAATDPNFNALDPYGRPIAGVFAVGNANGSIAICSEIGGINLGFSLVGGWTAGKALAGTDRGAAAHS